MAGPGFEPGKAEPADLQSAPFDRSGIPPQALSLTSESYSAACGRPGVRPRIGHQGSTSHSANFGPPTTIWVRPPERACRDVPVPLVARRTKRLSQRDGSSTFTRALQLWLPPRVAASPPNGCCACSRRLYLHAQDAIAEVGDQVVVGFSNSGLHTIAPEPPASSSPIARRHLPAAAVSKPIPCTDHMSWTRRKLPANRLKTATILWSVGEPLPSSHEAAGGRRSGLTGGTAELDREGLT